MGPTVLREKKKHTQTKPNLTLQLVTIHWGLKTLNNRSVQETEQYLYIFLPLIHRTVQLSWARSHSLFRSLPRMRLLCQRTLTHHAPDVVNTLRTVGHWLPLYHWQTATVWVKNLRLCSTEETKSPTSWMPWGFHFHFWVNYPFKIENCYFTF